MKVLPQNIGGNEMFSYYGTLCTEVYDFTKPVGYSIDGDIGVVKKSAV